MILSTLVTSQLHFEMCAGLYGHPVHQIRVSITLSKTQNIHLEILHLSLQSYN